MNFFYVIYFIPKKITVLLLVCCSLFSYSKIHAQQRPYTLIFSQNLKGGTTLFGNTLLHIKNTDGTVDTAKMNGNRNGGTSLYGNDNENMQFVDVDGNTGEGADTRNSSSANLVLPQGINIIKMARLYWGGRIATAGYDLSLAVNRKIKIRKNGSAAYTDIAALGVDQATISNGYTQYQAYADVTQFILQNGEGTYTAGNAPLTTGAITGGNNGGWCIVVAYENEQLNFNSIRVYDGFQRVYSNGQPVTSDITIKGLAVPTDPLNAGDAELGIMTWEGDANIGGDFLKINDILYADKMNPSENVWNGTISKNGIPLNSKYPDYTDQMGIDIDQFDVSRNFGILPGDTSLSLQFGTVADQYYPGLLTFVIKMKPEEGPLPVSLLTFIATLHDKKVQVQWSTSSENNCKNFIVQRSLDGVNFQDVGVVNGHGTTSIMHQYLLDDEIASLNVRKIYYRLKQQDYDGHFNLSKVCTVSLPGSLNKIIIAPIPFISFLKITYTSNTSNQCIVRIVDNSGRKLYSKEFLLSIGENIISIDNLDLPAGIYYLQLVNGDQVITRKISK